MRLAVFVTHPVQYHVPIWRALATESGVELQVFFFSDHSVRGTTDADFGCAVAWDVPLLDGYSHRFVRRDADLSRPSSVGLAEAEALLRDGDFSHVLIHGYTHRFERQVLRAARRLGIRTIVRGEFADAGRRRGLLKRVARDLYLRRFYARSDAFCYVGTEAHRHLSRLVEREHALFFSPYSVDTVRFEAQSRSLDRESCRRALGLASGVFTFLFAGKLIPRKAPLLLLDAISRLPDAQRAKAALVVVGDGALRDAVVARGERILGNRFHFAGFVNQTMIGRYYRAADALVLPSNYEAWGLVANEAMHFGLPLIVSDRVCSSVDLVIPDVTGQVFPSGDAAALTACLARLLADPVGAGRMGVAAQQHVDQFSTAASVAGLLAALRDQTLAANHV